MRVITASRVCEVQNTFDKDDEGGMKLWSFSVIQQRTICGYKMVIANAIEQTELERPLPGSFSPAINSHSLD